MADDWNAKLNNRLNRSAAYFYIEEALHANPALSLLTVEARRAIAVIAADSLPVQEDNNGRISS